MLFDRMRGRDGSSLGCPLDLRRPATPPKWVATLVVLVVTSLSAEGSCDAFLAWGTPKELELGVPEWGSRSQLGARQTRTFCSSGSFLLMRRQPLSRSQA